LWRSGVSAESHHLKILKEYGSLPTCRYDRQTAANFNRNQIGDFLPKAATPDEIFSPARRFADLIPVA
jgi:hypothetical protein